MSGALPVLSRIRRALFSSPLNLALTLAAAGLLLAGLPPLLRWAVFDACLTPDPAACRAAGGACWGFVAEKYRVILFGLYPYDQQWRPLLASAALVALLLLSARPAHWRRWLAVLWGLGGAGLAWLMWGGLFGLPFVSHERWGGLPLTLALSFAGLGMAFPLAVLLALGRRSTLPAVRACCVVYIELWRGVPLISVLFMASVMFPLFLPEGVTVDKLLRAEAGIVLFTAAYLAEAVRGGLQAVPAGQIEAADALGLGYWRKTWLVVLPQALRMAIPALVGQFITTVKDTSLVIVIGLYDLLGSTRLALAEPQWRPFFIEGYLVAALIYFLITLLMSRYSLFLERHLNVGHGRT